MTRLLPFLFVIPICSAANLAYSTYLRDGFTPFAISSDRQGNVYVAGSVIVDPAALQTSVAVAKIDPTGSRYLYFTLLDSAAADHVASLAVDATGNAFIAGWTTNPDFSSTGANALATAPSGDSSDPRGFVAKLNQDGSVAFAVLLGGAVPTQALGIALTTSGRIVVSGLTAPGGFPSMASAGINAAIMASWPKWYLMELDASASNVIFSVPEIGGSALVVDAQGNIYMAGSSLRTDYPSTPGAYQTTFSPLTSVCYGNCQLNYPGNHQHVTKVDSTGAKVIYSTGLDGANNTGLAVDAAGNAYVTALHSNLYPFTLASSKGSYGYLTKLDPTGSSAVFSIPVGGAGVQLDSLGALYVGGQITSYPALSASAPPVAPPAVFSQVPQACWPNAFSTTGGAYVMKVDPATGVVLDAQWIDGSAPNPAGIALAGGKVWMAGTTPFPDVPYTPGALAPANILPGPQAGAFLSAVDFAAQINAGAPAIACVLDQGSMMHVGAVAPLQLIALFGANLGPAQGTAAPDGTDTSLAGVSVTFNGTPAPLFYVSSSQVNVAVPAALTTDGSPPPPVTVMEINVNGVKMQRQFPFTASNLNLFLSLPANPPSCPAVQASGFQALATNADGSLNSCASPAKSGSTVSFYAHGAGAPLETVAGRLGDVQAIVNGCPAPVQQESLINAFVFKIDVEVPSTLLPCSQQLPVPAGVRSAGLSLSRGGVPVAPLALPPMYLNPFLAQLLPELFPPFLAAPFPAQSLVLSVWVIE